MRRLYLALVFLLSVAIVPTAHAGRPAARAAVKAPQAAKAPKSSKRAIVLVGMPGSGKTFLSTKLAAKLGAGKPLISGDIIREAVGKTRSAEEQSRRVLEVAKEFSKTQGEIGRRMGAKVHTANSNVVVVEGFRTPADLAAFKKAVPDTVVVAVEVPTQLRHSRMLKRGRAGEDNTAYLRKRDKKEREFGVDKVMKSADLRLKISNNSSRDADRAVRKLAQEAATN